MISRHCPFEANEAETACMQEVDSRNYSPKEVIKTKNFYLVSSGVNYLLLEKLSD